MKGRSLILIFLFLICVTQPVFAEEGSIHWQNSSSSEITATSQAKAAYATGNLYMYFPDAESLQGWVQTTMIIPASRVTISGGDGVSAWDSSVSFRYGSLTGPEVGTGIYGYQLIGSDYHIITISWLDLDITGYSGAIELHIANSDIQVSTAGSIVQGVPVGAGSSDVTFRYPYYFSPTQYLPFYFTKSITEINYDYYNTYSYTSHITHNSFEMDRTVYNSTRNYLYINGTWDNETSIKSTDYSKLSTDLDNMTWDFIITNQYGENESLQVNFVPVYGDASAVIRFNQSFYTSPEPVQLDVSINDMNPDNLYRVDLYYYDGMVAKKLPAFWNDTVIISNSTDSRVGTISTSGLTLPLTIYGILKQWDTNTGSETVIAYTDEVVYNPAALAPGSIWTQKENYNISEIFHIEFDTNYDTVQIELISATFYDIQTLEGSGWNYMGYMFNNPHNFTAYLIEGGVKTNYVDFTVSADTPFLDIHVSSVPINQGFCFSYYTDNTSDVITGYRPDGSIFWGPGTDLTTLKKVDICGPSSSGPAGTYTMSLLHDGIEYYNDTIEMTSANEYVYFEASKYETGDRMVINYYIMDSRQRIRLSDSIGTAVITCTCDAFYITPNMGNSLWFSLTDNNEYGMNVLTSIDAGSFRTGNWKVEIIDIDGKPLTNESTYDYTTVSREIESPEDATNEFIMILFSPEGLFMIFTACLTMMGLVAAHHPAGGAAGAVVGVGFGTYFNVLPIWMLLLMVIALVVLAGVSVAVYFKGKT